MGLPQSLFNCTHSRCLLTTIADSDPANVMFGKSIILCTLNIFCQLLSKTAAWMSPLVAKIENVIISSKWTHWIMVGQKEKPRHLEETLWFPEYCIGWIRIGNSGLVYHTVTYICAIYSNCPSKLYYLPPALLNVFYQKKSDSDSQSI